MFSGLELIIKRLSTDPDTISDLIKARAILSDALHSYLDTIQEIEVRTAANVADRRKQNGELVFPNPALRQAEVCRLLKADSDYLIAKDAADKTRRNLSEIDAKFESATRRNDADRQVAAMITAFVTTGQLEAAANIVKMYNPEIGNTDKIINVSDDNSFQETEASNFEQKTDLPNQTKLVTVLEARPASTEGTIRAYCRTADGAEIAIFAKNGNGQILQKSIGKQVKVECAKIKRGWFAYKVEPAA